MSMKDSNDTIRNQMCICVVALNDLVSQSPLNNNRIRERLIYCKLNANFLFSNNSSETKLLYM